MYGVLYAISAEIFPAKDRGTGNGLVSTAQRVFGVIVSCCPPPLFFSLLAADNHRLMNIKCINTLYSVHNSLQGPVIALYANITTSVPVYISGALIMSAGGLALLLPYEPRGHASM